MYKFAVNIVLVTKIWIEFEEGIEYYGIFWVEEFQLKINGIQINFIIIFYKENFINKSS